MARTPKERAADVALKAAIDLAQEAYGFTGLAVGYVIGVSIIEYEDDGQHSGVCWHLPEDQPIVSTLGTIELVRMRMHATYAATEDD